MTFTQRCLLSNDGNGYIGRLNVPIVLYYEIILFIYTIYK